MRNKNGPQSGPVKKKPSFYRGFSAITFAFQADNVGSIPTTRSTFSVLFFNSLPQRIAEILARCGEKVGLRVGLRFGQPFSPSELT